MKDKKIYIVLIIILVVFFLIMFCTLGIKNIRQSNYDATLVVGENTIWNYQNQKWLNITNSAFIQDLNWEKFHVFLDNEEVGSYSLWHDDKWYAFDDSNNAVVLNGNMLAYRSNVKIDVVDFKEEDVDVDQYILQVLEEHNLSSSSKFTTKYKIHFDFDSDGEEEDFYLISNVFPMDFNPDVIFSIVFMVKDQKITYLYEDISENQSFNGCKPYFYSILDINKDKIYEFILSCAKYSVGDQIDMLYQYHDREFKIVISN